MLVLVHLAVLVLVLGTTVQASLIDLFANRLTTRRIYAQPRALTVKRHAAVDLISKYSYPAESHEVETEDGYFLTLHRIPQPGKPVALLQHGIIASSDTWVLRGPDQDLAFMLYDEGYDVWLSNIRGNVYSRKHRTLNPDSDKEFWDFSFHEMAYYDMPAVIDHVLNVTEEKSLVYIGHSMGTTMFFIMCSMRPEYNSKITIMHALAPAAYIIHKHSPIWQFVFTHTPEFVQSCMDQQIYELLPYKKFTSRLGRALCNQSSPIQPLCAAGMFLVTGVDYQQFNMSIMPQLLTHYPAGLSLKTYVHFYGNVKNGTFRQYDYGKEENLVRYKNSVPPEYNMKKVTAPVALYYGDGDYIVKKEDAEALAARLPNLITVFRVPFPFFNHMDFLIGMDAKNLLYEQILLITQKYV